MQPLIITLDGPAGSGKSTVVRLLARRLELEFLDTGAMYRGLTAFCLDHRVDPASDVGPIAGLLAHVRLRFDWKTDPPRLHVVSDGAGNEAPSDRDVTDRLRDPDVTANVSPLSTLSQVRHMMVEAQRQIGRTHRRLVTEGRDQGSVVFPDAQVKFYLDARPEVRARRRSEQLRAAGKPADERQILEQILRRDDRDSHRADGPLICPPDALRVDTSAMTLEQVVDHLERHVHERLGPALGPAKAAPPAGARDREAR